MLAARSHLSRLPALLRRAAAGYGRAVNDDVVVEPSGSDAELVERVAGGDKRALSALYDRYAGMLLGVGLRIVGVRSEAEDLLHDVFLEVWKRAGDYDRARGSVRAWLVTRTRSRALDRRKSPRMARAVAYDDAKAERTASSGPAPDARIDGFRERARVQAALATLPDDQRACVELAYFDGLSTAEIGARLGCPAGTVKSRMSAAREKMRAALGEEGGAA